MVDFSLMFSNLESTGFYTFVLSWVLFLVIIYSIVTKAPFLKDIGGQAKQISVIIAAILSLYIVNYEWNGRFVGDYLTQMFGTSSLYIAGFLVLILFLGMGGFSINNIFGGKWVPAVMVLLAIMIFFNTGSAAQFNVDDETMTWLFMLLLVGGALWFLNSEPDKKKYEGSGTPAQSATPTKKPDEHKNEVPKQTPPSQPEYTADEKKLKELLRNDAELQKLHTVAKTNEERTSLIHKYAGKYGYKLDGASGHWVKK